MTILLVEDNPDLAEKTAKYLELEGMTVHSNMTGNHILHMLGETRYDCIVLDVGLPGKNGFEVCEEIRKEGYSIPVVFLTAYADTHSRVHGLNIGADDYLTKPFDMEELVARIHAHVRRTKDKVSPIIEIGDLTIHTHAREVVYKGNKVHLSPREFDLLHHLASHFNQVVSQMDIISAVWGEKEDLMFSRTVDVHISQLRKKLDKKLIDTVPSKGYIIRA